MNSLKAKIRSLISSSRAECRHPPTALRYYTVLGTVLNPGAATSAQLTQRRLGQQVTEVKCLRHAGRGSIRLQQFRVLVQTLCPHLVQLPDDLLLAVSERIYRFHRTRISVQPPH